MERDTVEIDFDTDAHLVSDVGLASPWQVGVGDGLPATVDNATNVTNPDTQIRAATKILTRKSWAGKYLRMCLAYDPALTSITDPQVQVFGRYSSTDPWERLRLRNNTVTSTLATAATDVTDGTLAYTAVNPSLNVYDMAGKNEFVIGVVVALAGSTGVTTNAKILVQAVSDVGVCCPTS